MNLKTYLRALAAAEKRSLAETAGTKVIYLIQIAGGHASPSAKMALAIERATRGAVLRHELRPDLYPLESSDGPQNTCEAATVSPQRDGYLGCGGREDGPPPCDEAAREGVS